MTVGNYATIFVQGQGKDDPFFNSSGSISGCLLEVNGAKVAPKFRGLHFAIYDYPSLSFKEARGFDPYSSSSETSAMISFIDSLQPGTMVLFCSRDTVDRKPPYQRMTTNAWNKIVSNVFNDA